MNEYDSHHFSLEQLKQLAADITRVLSIYGYIADSYIIEFFTDGLWEKLPCSWQAALHNLPSPVLAALLLGKHKAKGISYRSVWPLSLLALKVTAQTLAYPRTPKHNDRRKEFQENPCQSSMLNAIFRKHVKPKKQHEIRQLGKLVKQLSDVTGCEHVVDVGSGQGHLSRYLSFGFGLPVTAVEADQRLVAMSTKFDQELINTLLRESKRQAKNPEMVSSRSLTLQPPRHVLGWVNPGAPWEEFVRLLKPCDCLSSGTVPSKTDDTNPCQMEDNKHGVHRGSLCVGSTDMALAIPPKTSLEKDIAMLHMKNTLKKHDTKCTHSILNTPTRSFKDIGYAGERYSTHFKTENSSYCSSQINSESRTVCALQSCKSRDCCAKPKPQDGTPANTLNQHNLAADSKFLLTGLHACGDLSVVMLRHFARCPNVVGITSAACCHMKISTQDMPLPPGVLHPTVPSETVQPEEFGYPMSTWLSQLPRHKLSYKAREVSCHAIEEYCERLMSESPALDSHCYRAALETIIRDIDPTMKRIGVQTKKKAHTLSFEESPFHLSQSIVLPGAQKKKSLRMEPACHLVHDENSGNPLLATRTNVTRRYAHYGLQRVGLSSAVLLDAVSVNSMLAQHQNVVAYFSLALLLAPLVETLILLDRMIFVHEQGFHCELVPLFDPQLSPRNLVLVAAKPKLYRTPSSTTRYCNNQNHQKLCATSNGAKSCFKGLP